MRSKYLVFELLVVGTVLAATILAFPHLPSRIPIHWDIHGDPNGYTSRTRLLFWHPGIIALITIFANTARRLSAGKFPVERFGKTFDWMMLICICMYAFIDLLTLWNVVDSRMSLGRLGLAATFVCIAVLGNSMGKLRRNYFVGIRTPWTLASDRVWNATHRFAGKVNVIAGLAGVVLVLAGVMKAAFLLLFVALALEVVYSRVVYKNLQRSGEL